MRLGDFEIHLLVAGGWHPDGGTMYGVVPKVLWERQKPANERNQITAACVGVIVRHHGRVIVCETGIGTKLDAKRAQREGVWEPEGLLTNLKRLGIRPDEVDIVVSTHLHWDHAGGFTRRATGGGLELSFPKAKHFIQKVEWDFALDPDPRSRAGYIADDFTPVADAGLAEFLEGEAEVAPDRASDRAAPCGTPGRVLCSAHAVSLSGHTYSRSRRRCHVRKIREKGKEAPRLSRSQRRPPLRGRGAGQRRRSADRGSSSS
jgi:glyoxylase-like metal-dependent hydrolase (beta-lactamase superfamily II)